MIPPQERRVFDLEISGCNCENFCPLANGRDCPMTQTPKVTIYYRTDDEGGIHPDVDEANRTIKTALRDVGLTGAGSNPIPPTVGERLIEHEEEVFLGCHKLNAPTGTVRIFAERQRTPSLR